MIVVTDEYGWKWTVYPTDPLDRLAMALNRAGWRGPVLPRETIRSGVYTDAPISVDALARSFTDLEPTLEPDALLILKDALLRAFEMSDCLRFVSESGILVGQQQEEEAQ